MPDPVERPEPAVHDPATPTPPPTADTVVRPHPRPPRAGELSTGWRAITAATWIGVIVGLAAVWNASVQIGLSTWWLGPRSDPQPRYVQFAPFVPPVLMLLATINQMRWIPWMGLAASGLLAAVGVADLDRVASLAGVELAIAGAAAAVSIASFSGVYRAADRSTEAPTDVAAGAATDTGTDAATHPETDPAAS